MSLSHIPLMVRMEGEVVKTQEESNGSTNSNRSFTNSVMWLQKDPQLLTNVVNDQRVLVKLASTEPSHRKMASLKERVRVKELRQMQGVGTFLSYEREELRRDRETSSQVGVERHCVDVFCRYKVCTHSLTTLTNGQTCSSREGEVSYVALDCEMVGVGKEMKNGLARVSVVGYGGEVLFDRFVRPKGVITDYRTRYSGVRPGHMTHALQYDHAVNQVHEVVKGKVIVGHALHNDLPLLLLSPHHSTVRDTSHFLGLRRRAHFPLHQPASLKRFAARLLGKTMQTKSLGHCSVEDARTAMQLYRLVEVEWETSLSPSPSLASSQISSVTSSTNEGNRKRALPEQQSREGEAGRKRRKRGTNNDKEKNNESNDDVMSYLDDEYW